MSGILPSSNMSNREFTYFFHKSDFGPLLLFLISLLRLSMFFTSTLGLESSSNIILQHVFPPTSLNLHVRALQGQLYRLQTQLSFRYRGHLTKPLIGFSMCRTCNHCTGVASLSLSRRWGNIYPVVNSSGYRYENSLGRSLWYS